MYRYDGEITDKTIINFIEAHKKEKEKYKKMQDYYEGNSSILERPQALGNTINNKISNNYPGYITDMATGYFIGKPVNYFETGEQSEYLETIRDIYNYNDEQSENAQIAKECSIKGKSYEIIYLDENDKEEDGTPKLRFNQIDADEMFCVYNYDISPETLFAVRYYDIKKDEKTEHIVELYTKDEIIHYTFNGQTLTENERIPHYFSLVPVVCYVNNDETQGDFEKIITLIDAYDKAESDSINNLEYFSDCYLYLVGFKNTDASDIDRMRQNRVLLLDENGEAGFLTKNENSVESENVLNRIKNDIHKFSLVPDLTDEKFASTQTGIAIAYKLLGLEQLTVKKERKFKKSLQKRLEIITNYLNFKGETFDYRNIQIKFTRNIPVNDKENVEIVQMLQNIISKKTALSNLKMIDDVGAELKNIQAEQDAYAESLT